MAKSANTIVDEVLNHVNREGSGYKKWYAGITNDKQRRLHGEHNVPKEGYWFISRKAFSEEDARKAESILLGMGFEGGTGGGSNPTTVYAYKMTSITEP